MELTLANIISIFLGCLSGMSLFITLLFKRKYSKILKPTKEQIKNIEEILNKYQEILANKLSKGELLEVHYNEIVNSINKVLNKTIDVQAHTFKKLDRELDIYLTIMPSLVNASFTCVIFSHFASK